MNEQESNAPMLRKPQGGLSTAAPKLRGGAAPQTDVRIVSPVDVKTKTPATAKQKQ